MPRRFISTSLSVFMRVFLGDNKKHVGFDPRNGLIPSQIHNVMALWEANERQELGSNWRK